MSDAQIESNTEKVCETDDDCSLSLDVSRETSDEILAAMDTRNWWLKFFIRPCCPPPGAHQAQAKCAKLLEEVQVSEKFSAEQKVELVEIIKKWEQWYLKTPFCNKVKSEASVDQ